jgi:hypothetical protein
MANKYTKVYMVLDKNGFKASNSSTGTSIYVRKADALNLLKKTPRWYGEHEVIEFELVPTGQTFKLDTE